MRAPEAAVRAYAREKHFAEGLLRRWLAIDAAGRDALLLLAERLRLGENQLRDFFDQLEDIAARRACSLALVLQEPVVGEVLEQSRGRNQAIRALRSVLRRLRYPQMDQVEGRLRQLVKALRLPAGVQLELPQNLEGEHLSVTLRARSPVQLRAQAQAVLTAVEAAEIDEIFRTLEGNW